MNTQQLLTINRAINIIHEALNSYSSGLRNKKTVIDHIDAVKKLIIEHIPNYKDQQGVMMIIDKIHNIITKIKTSRKSKDVIKICVNYWWFMVGVYSQMEG